MLAWDCQHSWGGSISCCMKALYRSFDNKPESLIMDSPKDITLEQLIEQSRALIRQSEELKRQHEKLLRQLEDLQERTQTDECQTNLASDARFEPPSEVQHECPHAPISPRFFAL
jgi:hypothetical protein